MVTYARPYLERLVRSRFTTDALKDRMVTSLLTYARTIERLPGDIADIITRIRENRIGVNLDLEGIDEFNENFNHASTNIAYALLLAALLLSSAVLVHASANGTDFALYALGTVGSCTSFILALLLLIRNFRMDRQSRRRHRERRMKK